MKSIRTQFDESGFSGAVATPTCSSCCCCCCCVASAVAAGAASVAIVKSDKYNAVLTGQASLEDVKRTKKPIRSIVASFVAIVLGFFLISPAAQLSSAIDGNSIFGLILPILFVLSAMAAVAFFAYSLDFKGAGVRGAVKKAVILSILFVIAFAIEFYGAMLTSVVGLSSDITDISLDKYLLLALVAVVLTIIITKSFLASKRMVCQASLANRSNPPVEQANPQPEPPQQQNIQPSQTEPDHNEPDQSQTQ